MSILEWDKSAMPTTHAACTTACPGGGGPALAIIRNITPPTWAMQRWWTIRRQRQYTLSNPGWAYPCNIPWCPAWSAWWTSTRCASVPRSCPRQADTRVWRQDGVSNIITTAKGVRCTAAQLQSSDWTCEPGSTSIVGPPPCQLPTYHRQGSNQCQRPSTAGLMHSLRHLASVTSAHSPAAPFTQAPWQPPLLRHRLRRPRRRHRRHHHRRPRARCCHWCATVMQPAPRSPPQAQPLPQGGSPQ